MRKYQPIWEEIKSKGVCTIAAPLSHHRRIIKAVMKERTQDTLYRFELSERKCFARLDYTQESSKVVFKMVEFKSIEEKIGVL